MFLLCRCGGLRCGIAALHGLGVGRYGLGVFVLDDRYGWYKVLDSSLCSE